MSIDTYEEKFSLIGFGCPIPQMLIAPTSELDDANKADLLYLYAGIELTGEVPEPEPEPEPTSPDGAPGRGKRRERRYPRRIMVNGDVYVVRSWSEERELLQRLFSVKREERQQAEAAVDASPTPERKRRLKVVRREEQRLEARVEQVDEWAEQLRRWDEEILSILAH